MFSELLCASYRARAGGATAEQAAPGAAQINNFAPKNYSPTAFFVRAMSLGARALDYVGTMYFFSKQGREKDKRKKR